MEYEVTYINKSSIEPLQVRRVEGHTIKTDSNGYVIIEDVHQRVIAVFTDVISVTSL